MVNSYIVENISVFCDSFYEIQKKKKKKCENQNSDTECIRFLCLCVTEKLMDRANLIPCDTKGALELPAVQETALLLSVFQRPL